MTHVADSRLLELAGGARPNAGEAAHLAACTPCGDRLRADARLTERLRALARPEPSPGFAARVQQQFSLAQRRQRRQAIASLAFGFAVSLLVAMTLAAGVIANAGSIAAGAVDLLADLAVSGRAAVTVLRGAPFMGVMAMAATATAALACVYAVRRTALAYAGAK